MHASVFVLTRDKKLPIIVPLSLSSKEKSCKNIKGAGVVGGPNDPYSCLSYKDYAF